MITPWSQHKHRHAAGILSLLAIITPIIITVFHREAPPPRKVFSHRILTSTNRDDLNEMNRDWCDFRPNGTVCARYTTLDRKSKKGKRPRADLQEVREMHEHWCEGRQQNRRNSGICLSLEVEQMHEVCRRYGVGHFS